MSKRETFLCLSYLGVEWHITGTWRKGEKPTMYYKDGSGHPGDPPEFEIHEIWVSTDAECSNLIDCLRGKVLEGIEDAAIEKLTEADKERGWHLDEREET